MIKDMLSALDFLLHHKAFYTTTHLSNVICKCTSYHIQKGTVQRKKSKKKYTFCVITVTNKCDYSI